jgi:hypothetical protein
VGRNVVGKNYSPISGITPAVALTDRRKPPRKVSRDSRWAASPARGSELCSQGAAAFGYPVQSMNRRTDALSAKMCVRRHTVFVATVINVASPGMNYGKRRTPYVKSPNTQTVHTMEAWTRK